MDNVTVMIERCGDGVYTAVQQHKYNIGFMGCGKTIKDAMADLSQSLKEVQNILPELPDFAFDVKYAYHASM